MKPLYIFLGFVLFLALGCNSPIVPPTPVSDNSEFYYLDYDGSSVKVLPESSELAVVTQVVRGDFRPYIHPLLAPDSESSLTQYSPDHHRHQTGLYWGFTRVNGIGADEEMLKKWFYRPDKPADVREKIGRDFFHHPDGDYWKKDTVILLVEGGAQVKWQSVYDMLDEDGAVIMKETQTWTFEREGDKHLLSLEWQGTAHEDVTINEFDYGGLFLRMPWTKDVKASVVNAARQRDQLGEGQRAMWVNVGMEIDGLEEWGRIAIFDHPDNSGFPQTWRVDGQFGVGPVRARMGDWHIEKGKTESIQHRIVAYSGDVSDIEMEELWGDYVGDKGMYNTASLWGIAQEEGLKAKFLNASEAIDAMTIKKGYDVNAYASEPMITQPMAFCWDDKGRMWVAENRDYESRGYGFSNSGDSRILILEDTDGDGIADKSEVFLENIPFPSAIAVGFDGLYLGAPPNLLFVPDRDQDDRADEEDIEVLLTGWGIRDRHETINSFHWGPDGWLYGLEGFATPSKIRKPIDGGRIYRHGEAFPEDLLESEGVDINGGVWRYHPIKDRFEVVSHGFSNPWGIDHNEKGQLFITACVIPHLFHVIQGGIYHRQGGTHFNSYVYQDIQTIVDHRHRSAHGGARIYQSDAFPDDQQGKLFMANIHEHAVLTDQLEENGSGYTAVHGEDFMLANNAQWIGFSLEIGPEGGLYVLDWHDADICGKEVLNKETGRIFRITPSNSAAENWPGRYSDLSLSTDLQLSQYQESKSDWHSRRARLLLQSRAQKDGIQEEAIAHLKEILRSSKTESYRLKALWSLHITGSLDRNELLDLLKDSNTYVRGWAMTFLAEDQNMTRNEVKSVIEVLRKGSHPNDRLNAAMVMQRMDIDMRWTLAEKLVSFEEDSDDPNVPLMTWYALEPAIMTDITKAVDLAQASKISLISRHIARRLIDGNRIDEAVNAAGTKSSGQLGIVEGLVAGMEARRNMEEPKGWKKVYGKLKRNPKLSSYAEQISIQFGNAELIDRMLLTVESEKSERDEKSEAIKTLSSKGVTRLKEHLPGLLKDSDFRIAAIRAIAAFDDENLGRELFELYPDMNEEEKKESIQTLSSRPVYGRILTQALKDEKVSKRDIPPYIAIQLRRVVGNGFVEVWGPIDDISSDKETQYKKYRRLLSNEALSTADMEKGRFVFQRVCGSCHKMYEKGGDIGPDLTGSNRSNLSYLLGNIIEPSSELQDDYIMTILTTRDGRTYSGSIIAENDRQLTMNIAGQDEVILTKSEIQSREKTGKSVMPEGLLNNLTDKEIINLVAFMKSNQPPQL